MIYFMFSFSLSLWVVLSNPWCSTCGILYSDFCAQLVLNVVKMASANEKLSTVMKKHSHKVLPISRKLELHLRVNCISNYLLA